MKALLILKSLVKSSSTIGTIALISLLPQLVPQIAFAQDLGQPTAQIFEINDFDSSILNQSPKQNDNQNSLSIETVSANDPLVISLKEYLKKHNSPLEEYAAEMVLQPQWQRALAISWVESNFCRRHADKNCSGIGVAPGHKLWRKYPTHLDWFKDMTQLMEKPIYKEKYTTFQKMKGIYVQPGSANWVNGAQKKYNELMEMTEEAESQRQKKALEVVAIYTFESNLN